jgi:DNA repair protein RecN (Recombination protein N)
MLREIHIQNYAVIENLRVEFEPGLNVLSGETGSGKSILIDALGLALGGRASAEVIRTGQERAVVTAVFRAARRPAWQAWLEEFGIADAGEGELILRREIQSGGRSRLLVNDQPVTVAAVRALAPRLVEIHGQSEHFELLEPAAQLDLLDQFAGVDEWLDQVAELHVRRRALLQEFEKLGDNEQDRLRRVDMLSFQVKELEQAHLVPGEDVRLEEEKRVLVNLEKIRAAAGTAFEHLYEDEGSACSRLAAVSRALDELARYDTAAAQHAEPLASARAVLDDIAHFLRDYAGKLQANPHRLEEIEDRLALIDRLKRKYGRSVEEILAYADDARRQLSGLEHADERRAEVARELQKQHRDYLKAARRLSGERREAALRFEKLVRAELAQLGMEKARFEVHFEALAFEEEDLSRGTLPGGARGIDRVEFHVSPNPGEELRPLERSASGGELSRLMLALKTVVGNQRPAEGGKSARRAVPTFIFDEIDAGIGGRIAEAVGRRLKRLARDAQVLCVTHQAQIACFADRHFFVDKQERAGRTVTLVSALEGDKQRAAELARMLSGAEITDTALKHAAAMLKQAANA